MLLASFDSWEMSLKVFLCHRHGASPLFSGGKDGTVCTGSSPPLPLLTWPTSLGWGTAPAFPLSYHRDASLLLTHSMAPRPQDQPGILHTTLNLP